MATEKDAERIQRLADRVIDLRNSLEEAENDWLRARGWILRPVFATWLWEREIAGQVALVDRKTAMGIDEDLFQ